MPDDTPTPTDTSTPGQWTAGDPGRDPRGEPTRPAMHAPSLVPISSGTGGRDETVNTSKHTPSGHGVAGPGTTAHPSGTPASREGACTTADAPATTMRRLGLGAARTGPFRAQHPTARGNRTFERTALEAWGRGPEHLDPSTVARPSGIRG